MVSALILTLNEEKNISRCLESLKWCDDVVILDSFSTDRTREVADSYGVRFFQREFDDYASQRNYGLDKIEYRNPWLLMVDADEEVPQDLVEEIKALLSRADEKLGLVRMRRKDYFLGSWIKHASGYPTWFGRLVKIGCVRVEREVNEEYVTEGRISSIKGHLNHYPFNKGFESWLDRHNRYSSLEADIPEDTGTFAVEAVGLLSTDPVRRRKNLKALIYRMPLRPLIVFMALYVFRGGFLHGRAGFHFCLLKSFYEYMTVMKIMEKKLRKTGLPL